MKHKFLERAASTALGLGIAGAAVVALLYVAQKYFGLFAYPQLTKDQVDKVARRYLSHEVITKADGPNYSRGIINFNGTLYYFKWRYQESFEVFPVIVPERYSTDTSLLGAPSLVNPV